MDESAASKASLTATSPLDDNSESPKKLNPCLGRSQSLDSAGESKRSNLRSESRRGFFSKFRSAKEAKGLTKRGSFVVDSFNENEKSDGQGRPAFHSALHGHSSSNKKLEPRAVAIPYSRIKKDRFYDWPPDPTVSRATPSKSVFRLQLSQWHDTCMISHSIFAFLQLSSFTKLWRILIP